MKKYFAFLMLFGLLFSCEKTEDNQATNELEGEWNLITVTCECPIESYDLGEHVWTFDTSADMVTVANAQQALLQILESGSYEIVLTDDKVTIESVAYDYYFEGESLFLANQPELDGPLMKFVKN